MNDNELTPAEHADVRARLLQGAVRIKPVGRHRDAWVAGAVAVAVVAALAGGVGVAATLSTPQIATTPSPTATAVVPTPTPTPTSTPTREPVTPAVVLDGDCARLLDEGALAELLGDGATGGAKTSSPFNIGPDEQAGPRLLSGFTCSWGSADGIRRLDAAVFPRDAVASSVQAKYSALSCSLSGPCEVGRSIDDVWVGVAVVPATSRNEDGAGYFEDGERMAALALDRMALSLDGASGVAVPPEASWWKKADCTALEPVVSSVVGRELEPSFPGDAVPEGAVWDTLVEAGLDAWCPWHAPEGGPLIEVVVQAGIGAPEIVNDATEIAVAGAEAAWVRPAVFPEDDFVVLAVTGPNRILVRYLDRDRADFDENTVAALTAQLIAALG